MGKLSSKTLKAGLLSKGITTGHFAILEETIIAGAADKSQAGACAASLVAPELFPGITWLNLG